MSDGITSQREVLFAAAEALREALVSTVANAPASLAPLDAVAAGLAAVAAELPDRETARQRQMIIAANPELRERELIKDASLAAALAAALRGRGLPDPAAALAAEVGMAVFRVASERWINDPNDRELPQHIRESLDSWQASSRRADVHCARRRGCAPHLHFALPALAASARAGDAQGYGAQHRRNDATAPRP